VRHGDITSTVTDMNIFSLNGKHVINADEKLIVFGVKEPLLTLGMLIFKQNIFRFFSVSVVLIHNSTFNL
jgi:hypothetical protein